MLLRSEWDHCFAANSGCKVYGYSDGDGEKKSPYKSMHPTNRLRSDTPGFPGQKGPFPRHFRKIAWNLTQLSCREAHNFLKVIFFRGVIFGKLGYPLWWSLALASGSLEAASQFFFLSPKCLTALSGPIVPAPPQTSAASPPAPATSKSVHKKRTQKGTQRRGGVAIQFIEATRTTKRTKKKKKMNE